MSGPPLTDAAARSRIATDLNTSFLVEAAAGTGKTTALVSRLQTLILQGRVTMDQVCAMTFTRKAGGELRLRLRESLEKARRTATGAEAKRAETALQKLEAGALGTIHGFAAMILRERPLEVGLDPTFRVEEKSLARIGAYSHDWLEAALDRNDPVLKRYLVAHGGSEASLKRPIETLWDHRDLTAVAPGVGGWNPGVYSPPLFAKITKLASTIEPLLDKTSQTYAKLEPLLSLAKEFASAGPTGATPEWQEAKLLGLEFSVYGGVNKLYEKDSWSVKPGVARQLRTEAGQLLDKVIDFKKKARVDMAHCLIRQLSTLLSSPADPTCAEARMRQAGVIDSLGLLIHARDLVRDDLTVRRAFQERYPVLLVDEVQDNDPLQFELIMLLAAPSYTGKDWRQAIKFVEPGRLFMVGDPKQSIFNFRRADLDLYEEVKAELLKHQTAELLNLTTNFRSRPGIANFVNTAFALIFQSNATNQPTYVPIAPHRAASPQNPGSVIWLRLPCSTYVSSIRETEPEAVAEYLATHLEINGVTPPSPLYVEEEDEHGQAVERVAQPRDVAFLFRQLKSFGKDLTEPYTAALAKRGIPSVLFSGSSFRGREEVGAAITVLRAIERPDDAIAVYGALKGPFFAHPESELLGKLGNTWRLDPRRIHSSLPEALKTSLGLLKRLHWARNTLPIARTIQELYDTTRIFAVQAAQSRGDRRIANLIKIQRLARAFDEERGEATSFRAFVERLQQMGDESDSPLAEEGRGGVRFLTLHKAKGLEFPIVYLVDPTTQAFKGGIPVSRLYNRRASQVVVPLASARLPSAKVVQARASERAESERLLYVAATRARDALIVPRVVDYSDDKFDRLLLRLSPHLEQLTNSGAAHEVIVAQGALTPATPISSTVSTSPRQDYETWLAERSEAGSEASEPTQAVTSVTARCKEDSGVESGTPTPPDPEPELVAWSAEATGVAFPGSEVAMEFGTFVHLVLSTVPLDAKPETVRAYAVSLVHEFPQAAPYLGEACEHASWALAAPLLERARQADHVARELPVSYVDGSGVLVEGVIDLLFEVENTTTLVDYKTGVRLPSHATQLQLYADIVKLPNAEKWGLYTRLRKQERFRG